MNVKTRFVGMAVAVALSFGLSNVTLAETQTTSQVTLEDGGCSPSISAGTVNFGTYAFDAEQGTYLPKDPETDGKAQFIVSDTANASTKSCSFQVTASALTTEVNNLSIDVTIIEAENIANSDQTNGTSGDAVITVSVAPGGDKAVNATIRSWIGSASLDPAIYAGEITVSNAANSG